MVRVVRIAVVVAVGMLLCWVLVRNYLTLHVPAIEDTLVGVETAPLVGSQGRDEVLVSDIQEEPMNIEQNWQNFTPEYMSLTPQVVHLGETEVFARADDLSVKLIDVLDDGRCPANVNCGHSGWATVSVEIHYQGTITQHEMRIYGGNPNVFMPPEVKSNRAGSGNVVAVGPYRVFLVALRPYPLLNEKIEPRDYWGLFLADTTENLDLRKQIVANASEELQRRLPNHKKYYPVGLTATGSGTAVRYRVHYSIPYESIEAPVWVDVERIDEQLRAVDFGR